DRADDAVAAREVELVDAREGGLDALDEHLLQPCARAMKTRLHRVPRGSRGTRRSRRRSFLRRRGGRIRNEIPPAAGRWPPRAQRASRRRSPAVLGSNRLRWTCTAPPDARRW